MSSRSPRGSISGASSSAEVAADFEESLKDLQTNNRYEISNLTIIAKENTEHAQAISRTLENHIKTTSPSRKLPALFLLDSIVKNVGTPYTVYLGRNLFSTFMDAYTLVDGNTRRNMEAMLKTWKEPVPGSLDPRPVFPTETVRPMENALIKAKTAAIQHQRQPQAAYLATGTPPQSNGQTFAPPKQSTPQPFVGYGSQQPTPHQQHPSPYAPPHQHGPLEVDAMKNDIQSLIPRFQQKLSANPNDISSRNQLGALEALFNLLGIRQFNPNELQDIRNQVSRLSAALPPLPLPQPQPTPQPAVPTPQWQIPLPYNQSYQTPQSAFPAAPPVPNQPSAPANLSPEALSGLQALLSNVQKPSTPQLRAAMPGFRDASHSQLHTIQNHAAAPTTNGAADLISSLTKAGLINLPASSAPNYLNVPPATAAPSIDATNSLLKSLQSVLPPSSHGGTPLQAAVSSAGGSVNVPVSAASLKVFRPELVHALYDAQSNQCNTCGRRFLPTEDGRNKKSRHLDWHFRTNQRIADPNTNRGHHRNWYVDEREWLAHVEFDPSTTTASAADAEVAAKAKKGPQDRFVRAPAGMTKNTCNICFEEMKSSYSEDLQDWIFSNATAHNGRIVHATCLAEMTKPQLGGGGAVGSTLAAALASVNAGQRDRSATPDSLLGKRKAEYAMIGGSVRQRIE